MHIRNFVYHPERSDALGTLALRMLLEAIIQKALIQLMFLMFFVEESFQTT